MHMLGRVTPAIVALLLSSCTTWETVGIVAEYEKRDEALRDRIRSLDHDDLISISSLRPGEDGRSESSLFLDDGRRKNGYSIPPQIAALEPTHGMYMGSSVMYWWWPKGYGLPLPITVLQYVETRDEAELKKLKRHPGTQRYEELTDRAFLYRMEAGAGS